MGNKKSICLAAWPVYETAKIKDVEATIVVQVNGKVRANFSAAAEVSEEEAKARALELPAVGRWLAGKSVKKTIFVKGRLINFVI